MYKFLFSIILSHLPPEAAHRLGFLSIRVAGSLPGVSRLLRSLLAPVDPILRVQALGLDFPGPLGLAAGFDKDARGSGALSVFGFAFIETGTVTAQPQPGNPKPRLFRLVRDRALVNRMGSNNRGAAAVAAHLRARRSRNTIVGVNIGRTKIVPEAGTISDYVASARLLADVADYMVINVSSPNTPGLRELQSAAQLRPLLNAVKMALDSESVRRVPLLVKIAPDLSDADIDAIADLALEIGLDGIIATNTTITRDNLVSARTDIDRIGAGGLSGAPLKHRALHVLRRLRDRVGDRIVLIAAGGIETPEDAWERLQAGATLLQAYTGFIYGGPRWPWRIHTELAHRARQAGLSTIQHVIGQESP